MKKYPAALLAVPLAASMLLAGCSGGAQADAESSPPTGSPPTTTTPAPTTTSATPTTAVPKTDPKTDPNIPSAARARTRAGAEAFVRYFYDRLDIAWTTPQAGILSPLCQPSAKACAGLDETAAELTKAGHHFEDNPVTVMSVHTISARSPNQYDLLATVVQEPRREIDGTGKSYGTERRRNLGTYFVLVYTDQAWSVMSIKKMK